MLPTVAEYEREHRRIRAHFTGLEHDRLDAALLVLAEPELRIEISGRLGEGEKRIRLLGAVSRGRAVAAVQHPGGEVVIRGCEPYDLGRQLVAQLPDVDAGSVRGAVFRRSDGEGTGAVAAVLDRPSASQGVVTVIRGSRRNPRATGGIAWRDIDGDGRYLVWENAAPGTGQESTVTVRPGTSWDLLDAVARLTGRVAAGHPV